MPAEKADSPLLLQPDAQPGYVATPAFLGTHEYDLSLVDDPATQASDRAMPADLLAQGNESSTPAAPPGGIYQLAPDFQPLHNSSPYLVATLTTVAVQFPKSEAPRAVSALSAQIFDQVEDAKVVGLESTAPRNKDLSITSHPAETPANAVLLTTGYHPAADLDVSDGYSFGGTWDQVVPVAIPAAGLVFAFGFRRLLETRFRRSSVLVLPACHGCHEGM
jgi:hypothetical protein